MVEVHDDVILSSSMQTKYGCRWSPLGVGRRLSRLNAASSQLDSHVPARCALCEPGRCHSSHACIHPPACADHTHTIQRTRAGARHRHQARPCMKAFGRRSVAAHAPSCHCNALLRGHALDRQRTGLPHTVSPGLTAAGSRDAAHRLHHPPVSADCRQRQRQACPAAS